MRDPDIAFFGPDAPFNKKFGELTVYEFSKRLNKAFKWMAERCDIPFERTWIVKGQGDQLVFPDYAKVNVHGIAEAHAVAHELSLLHSYGDNEFLLSRLQEALNSAAGHPIQLGRIGLDSLPIDANWPAVIRHRALLACTSEIDLSVIAPSDEPLYVEDQLPWLRFSRKSIFLAERLRSAFTVLTEITKNPIYGPKSNWAALTDLTVDDRLESLANACIWLGVDLQVYSIHRNFKTLAIYFSEYAQGNRYAYDKVNNEGISSNYLIEYQNELFWYSVDLKSVYKGLWEKLNSIGFARFSLPGMQALCHLLNGSTVRNEIAHFLREQVPSPAIIVPKFTKGVARELDVLNIDSTESTRYLNALGDLLHSFIENGRFGRSGPHGFLVSEKIAFIH